MSKNVEQIILYRCQVPVLLIRIRWIRMFLGLLDPDPDPDPLVRGTGSQIT
jgi:hypothetical protein